jgi:hypothetical protein
MTRIKCYSVDENGLRHEVKCKGGGFAACREGEVKNGIFHFPYPYDKGFGYGVYCSAINRDTIWIEYGLEQIMKEIIKKHEEIENEN